MTTMFAQTTSLTGSTTASSTPQNKVTHSVTSPSGQSFIVFFSASVTVSNVNTRAKVDLVVDGTEVATFSPRTAATAEDHNVFFFHRVTGKSADFDCRIDYSSTNNTNNVTISDATIAVWRYDSITGLDLQYAEANATSTGLTASYVDGASASFTPTSTGNYFVLGALGIAPGSTTVSALAQMSVDGTIYPITNNTTGRWAREASAAVTDAFFSANFGTRQSLTGGASRTVKVQASNESGTTGTWQYSRILAFREDAFTYSQYASADTASENATTSTTYQTRATATTDTPSEALDHLVLAGMHHGLIVVPSEAERSQARVVVDGTEVQMSEMRYKENTGPSDRLAMGVGYVHNDAAAFTVTTEHRLQSPTDDKSAAKNSYIIVLREMDVDTSPAPAVSDSITLSESIDLELDIYINVSDSITVEDIPRYYDDEILVLESVEIFVESGDGSLGINKNETITLTENVSLDVPINLSVSESITVSESIQTLLTSFIEVSESVTVTETVNVAYLYLISVSDSITIAENIARVLECLPIISESVTVTDTLYALQIDKKYTRAEVTALPSDDSDLSTEFTQQEYADVLTSNNVRVET